MAILFYALYFAMQFVCTLPKAPGLTAVSEAERYDFKNYGCSKMYGNVQNERIPKKTLLRVLLGIRSFVH